MPKSDKKKVHFIFYQEKDYGSERLLALHERVNPPGFWRLINIYDEDVRDSLPIRIDSIPSIYNASDKELYTGEYVYEYMRSFDTLGYRKYVKMINERLSERDDNELETIEKRAILRKKRDTEPLEFDGHQEPMEKVQKTPGYVEFTMNQPKYSEHKIPSYDPFESNLYVFNGNKQPPKQICRVQNSTGLISDQERDHVSKMGRHVAHNFNANNERRSKYSRDFFNF